MELRDGIVIVPNNYFVQHIRETRDLVDVEISKVEEEVDLCKQIHYVAKLLYDSELVESAAKATLGNCIADNQAKLARLNKWLKDCRKIIANLPAKDLLKLQPRQVCLIEPLCDKRPRRQKIKSTEFDEKVLSSIICLR